MLLQQYVMCWGVFSRGAHDASAGGSKGVKGGQDASMTYVNILTLNKKRCLRRWRSLEGIDGKV